MIPLIILGISNIFTLGLLAFVFVRDQRERSALVAAALQANNLPDAKRAFAQADQDARRRVEKQLEDMKARVNEDGTLKMPEPVTPKPVGI